MNHLGKSTIGLVLLLLSMITINFAQLKPKEPKYVAIFLYQGVELLDFAGPGEVFSSSGFKTYTVSVDGNELTSQGFLTIKPQYSVATAPAPDIIVFPGGSSEASSKDKRVLDWIKKNENEGSFFMSVCTGAGILANTGMLTPFKHVTTFHGYIPGLQAILPKTKVLENTRFVDNGNVITTAGVSAGIDGALHLVSRIKGLEAAKSTAYYMEYDKWNPDNGLVDKRNEFLENLATQQQMGEKSVTTPSNGNAPYIGEFKNLALELESKNQLPQAELVLQEGIKFYPNAGSLYSSLAGIYTKLGKPSPLILSEFKGMLKEGKVDDAISRYEKDKKAFPKWKIYSEGDLNEAGYFLLFERKDTEGAIKVFQLAVKEFPQSGNAYDSLGEAYLKAGKKEDAIINYKKALALDETNQNARKVLKEIETK